MEYIEQALRLKTELDKLRPINPEQEAIIMQKFRLDWDYHSNHLEGNSLTYGETKALILFGITAQGKPLKDHNELTHHDEVIKWIIEIVKGEYPLTEQFIRDLHEHLLNEPYEVEAITPDGKPTKKRVEVGKYKKTPNHVLTKTGEIFRFATPEETQALMGDLIKWYREKEDSPDVNPIILAAEFHYRFVRIHPFDDGNGRISRILMNFILMQFGYPPVIIKTEDKGNYFSALQLADSGNIEPFIEYIAGNLVRSLELMIAGAKGESIEEPDDLDKEIALLEQKLMQVSKKAEIFKSDESVLNIYDNSIVPLLKVFVESCKKMDKWYVKSELNIMIDHIDIFYDNQPARLTFRDKVNGNISNIKLSYYYTAFRQMGFDEFGYQSSIEFDFKLRSYLAKTSQNKKSIEKPYGLQLTDKEIDELVKIEIRNHTSLIESKLNTMQNKKSQG